MLVTLMLSAKAIGTLTGSTIKKYRDGKKEMNWTMTITVVIYPLLMVVLLWEFMKIFGKEEPEILKEFNIDTEIRKKLADERFA